MNAQNSMSPIKPTSPVEVFSTANYLDTLDTEFKRTITNFIREFTEFREDTNKHIFEL